MSHMGRHLHARHLQATCMPPCSLLAIHHGGPDITTTFKRGTISMHILETLGVVMHHGPGAWDPGSGTPAAPEPMGPGPRPGTPGSGTWGPRPQARPDPGPGILAAEITLHFWFPGKWRRSAEIILPFWVPRKMAEVCRNYLTIFWFQDNCGGL